MESGNDSLIRRSLDGLDVHTAAVDTFLKDVHAAVDGKNSFKDRPHDEIRGSSADYPTVTPEELGHSCTEFDRHNNQAQQYVPNNPETFWSGSIAMLKVGQFRAFCRQIAGSKINSFDVDLPKTIFIDGRISGESVEKYLKEHHTLNSRVLVALEFFADQDLQGSPESLKRKCDENITGFMNIFSYFHSRSRYAVVGSCSSWIKDMYLIPLDKLENVPDIVKGFKEFRDDAQPRRERFLGVIVLNKRVPLDKSKPEGIAAGSGLQLNTSSTWTRDVLELGDRLQNYSNSNLASIITPNINSFKPKTAENVSMDLLNMVLEECKNGLSNIKQTHHEPTKVTSEFDSSIFNGTKFLEKQIGDKEIVPGIYPRITTPGTYQDNSKVPPNSLGLRMTSLLGSFPPNKLDNPESLSHQRSYPNPEYTDKDNKFFYMPNAWNQTGQPVPRRRGRRRGGNKSKARKRQ